MIHRWWLELDNACHVNHNLYRWWLELVNVGRLYQADNSKRRVRRLTHQFGTEWQNYINLILLKDNDKWRRNNITFVTNLFPYFLNPLFPLPKWPHAQNPCPIRLSAGGGGAKSAPLNSSQLFEPKFIFKICIELNVSTSYRLNVFKYNTS